MKRFEGVIMKVRNSGAAFLAAGAAVMLLGAFGAAAAEKPIELSYSSFFPASYGMGQAATAWAKEKLGIP